MPAIPSHYALLTDTLMFNAASLPFSSPPAYFLRHNFCSHFDFYGFFLGNGIPRQLTDDDYAAFDITLYAIDRVRHITLIVLARHITTPLHLLRCRHTLCHFHATADCRRLMCCRYYEADAYDIAVTPLIRH